MVSSNCITYCLRDIIAYKGRKSPFSLFCDCRP